MIAAHGSNTEQPKVMATEPPSRPLQTSVMFQCPIKILYQKGLSTPPRIWLKWWSPPSPHRAPLAIIVPRSVKTRDFVERTGVEPIL
ncbi:hypothetical protein V6N11_038625 [Hibiscus sabdariffa]|uniref:Uncharacterized protein n=1 Tax=Hibiscus sabdariffa TaxID=183260 RepID=A0ABR2SKK9_9ROSI